MKKNAATDAVAAPSNHTLKEEKMDPQKLVEHFSMSPHPEGGFFAETYRSQGAIPADALPGFGGTRNFSTGILFLLRRGEYSHLHRLKQDEMWHFYLGIPPEELKRIFQPFYRASNTREYAGHGVGLSLSLRILSTYGAKVNIISDLGVGTSVEIDFG